MLHQNRESGAKLLNVAFSRPKHLLIVFANIKYLEERLPSSAILRGLITDIEDKGKIIDVKDIIKLAPWDLPKRPNLKPKTRVDFNEEESGIFDENNFEKPFENDLRKAKKTHNYFFSFLYRKKNCFLG